MPCASKSSAYSLSPALPESCLFIKILLETPGLRVKTMHDTSEMQLEQVKPSQVEAALPPGRIMSALGPSPQALAHPAGERHSKQTNGLKTVRVGTINRADWAGHAH